MKKITVKNSDNIFEQISKVCLLATNVCNIMLAIETPWAIVGMLTPGVNEHIISQRSKKYVLINQFQRNVEDTISELKERYKESSLREMLDELSDRVIVPTDIKAAIKQTETYRIKYFTEMTAQKVANDFDEVFIEKMSGKQELCNFYVLCNHKVTLESLKDITTIVNKCYYEISETNKITKETNKNVLEMSNTLHAILTSASYVIIQTGIFFLFCLFTFAHLDANCILSVTISFIFSEFFSYVLYKNVIAYNRRKNYFISPFFEKANHNQWQYVLYIVIKILIAASIFSVMLYLLGVLNNSIEWLIPLAGIVISEIICAVIRTDINV